MSSAPRYRFLVCDLDDTLYPTSAGIMPAVGRLINRYMIERVGISPDEAKVLRRLYFNQYGTTMRGLIVNYGIDPDDYLTFVHDVPLEEYIRPNPALDAMLGSIPLRKVVFTNAPMVYANRVLDILRIRHCFERVFSIESTRFQPKPATAGFMRLLSELKVPAANCVMVEDSLPALQTAKKLGMKTVFISPRARRPAFVDVRLNSVLALPKTAI